MYKKIGKICLVIVLVFFGLVTIVPFVWMLFSSFKQPSEIYALDQTFLPQVFTTENYASLQERFNFLRYFGNSLFVASVVTLIVIYTSTLCGFVLSKYEFKGRGALFGLVVGTMMIPWSVTIIPKYSMFMSLGFLDTYWALILPVSLSGFGVFLMRQSIGTIPNEILEAARVDGASEFYIFHRIIFPMARNGISALAIFQFLGIWEDYLWPYLVINTEEKQLLAVGLNMFSGRYSTDYGGLFAATTISILPVILVYIIFQKRFIEGIANSAVKG